MTQKRYVVRHGDYDTADRYFDKEHFETNQKSLRLPVQKLWLQIVVFVFSLTLTFDLCSIFFVKRIVHDVLEYPCEVSLESVQYEWVICCG